MLSGLVLAALARVVSETRTVRRGFTIKVERYRITDDGRRGLPTSLTRSWPSLEIVPAEVGASDL